MKTTNYSLFTSKNNISNDVVYNFMFRGGVIRRLSSGIYILLPNGLRVLNNIINIIKYELEKLNSIEIMLPIINPSNIWEKSGRFLNYGDELFKLSDRRNNLFILSPTHEEVISKLICDDIINFYSFPKIFYQIQTKFRDEVRPRLGLNRTKEFFMKDAYSFHKNLKCLDETYYLILDVYFNIFNKLGLNVYCKKADSGNMGGSFSHEFHVISSYGENKINILKKNVHYSYSCLNKKYFTLNKKIYKKIKLVSIEHLNIKNKSLYIVNIHKFVKTFLMKMLMNNEIIYIFVLIPYKKKIDLLKIKNIYFQAKNIKIFNDDEIFKKFGCKSIFLGPWNSKYSIIADYSLINFLNFVIGSSIDDNLYFNVNWNINIKINNFFLICHNECVFLEKFNKKKINKYKKVKSVEIAHLFKLKDQYTNIFCGKNSNFDQKIYMGCYGIGLSRLISVIVDCYHNDNGIIWPNSIANFKLGLIPVNMYNDENLIKLTYEIYNYLMKYNLDILLDDRKLHIGKMITDFELIGVPNFIILSKKTLLTGLVEYRNRLNNLTIFIDKNKILNYLVNEFSND